MKRFLFFAITLSSLQTMAFDARPDFQSAEIRTYNYAPINVWIDGRLIVEKPVSLIKIHEISPGKHFLKIVKYKTGRFHNYRQIIYKGYVFIKPNCRIEMIVDHANRLQVIQHHYRSRHHDRYRHHEFEDRDADDTHGAYYDESNYLSGEGSVMSKHEFKNLKRLIRAQSFESEKLDMAKQNLQNHWIISKQVRDIMYLLNYESSRLNFAKYAYDYTIDKDRYYRVYDALNYRSSADELDLFLSRH